MPDKNDLANLWESSSFAEALLQHLAVATFVIDANHRVIFWNKACETLTGIKSEEVIGTRDQWRGFYPDKRPCLADLLLDNHFSKSDELYSSASLMTEIDGFAGENWCVSANGIKRYLEFEAGAVCNELGEIVAVIECLRDRTESRVLHDSLLDTNKHLIQAERRALINEKRFQLALSNSKGAVWELDTQSGTLTTTPSWPSLLGFNGSKEQNDKSFWLESIHKDDTERVSSACQALFSKQSQTIDIEYRIRDSEENWKWYLTQGQQDPDYSKSGAIIGTHTDITQLKENEQLITEMAFYDPLTELPNRRLLIERLKEEISLTHRQGNTGALMFLDLDNFKMINDSLGHDAGDELLIEVARRLKRVIRESDMAARLGGDEFVVLLGQLDYDMSLSARNVEKVAQTLLTEINKPYNIKEQALYVTPSIGITLFPAEDDTPGILLKQADAAMYRAKESGKNSVHFFHPAIQEAADSRIKIEGALRHALKNNEFELYFQPQIDTNNQLIGAEALIRWQHPETGTIPPGEFIPIAEESGLIIDIGHWVIESACKHLAAWSKERMEPPQISINISPRQFRQSDFVSNFDQLLHHYNVDPDKLVIELTEGILFDDIDDTISKMHALRALGLRFSLDDFGTGYSSLAYLQKLPLDHIKIDQTFVRNLDQNPNNAAIVETVISMGHNLNLGVIAEGVETQAELNFLKQKRCCEFQGYYFFKPLPIEQFEVLLKPAAPQTKNRALH